MVGEDMILRYLVFGYFGLTNTHSGYFVTLPNTKGQNMQVFSYRNLGI